MKYIIIAFIVTACHNSQSTKVFSNEKLDTIQSGPAIIHAKPVLLETAFVKGTAEKVNNSNISFYGITIGKLKIPTGRIVACDPFLMEEYGKPFTQIFPTGEFPIQLSIAKNERGEALAFSRIQFSDQPVRKWEYALLEGQPPIPLEGEETYGYVVDAGIGSFMDQATVKALDQKLDQLHNELYKEMEKHLHNKWKYTMYNVGEYNLAAFSAGFGDGRYLTYIGFDENGKPCRLVTDFGLFHLKKK